MKTSKATMKLNQRLKIVVVGSSKIPSSIVIFSKISAVSTICKTSRQLVHQTRATKTAKILKWWKTISWREWS